MNTQEPQTIESYISSFPDAQQKALGALYALLRSLVPKEATEKISWQMPTFVYHGNLLHFAAFKNHLGLYPGPKAIEAFEDDLKGYKYSKGTVQIPYDTPLPKELIKQIVDFRVNETLKT